MRFELPAGLTEEEEQAILVALERYLAREPVANNTWSESGRAEGVERPGLPSGKRLPNAWRAAVRGPWNWSPDRRRSGTR
ncbi:MAG: hypothetical protein WD757_04185 [Actinomycetota bacterium]